VFEEKAEAFVVQEGWDSVLRVTNAGRLQAVVRYGHMKKYEKSHVVLLDEVVEVDFYNRSGRHTSHLISETGEYHEQTEDVVGIGNVVVNSDSGMTLRTDELRWDNRRGKIISDTVVMVITLQRDTLYGVGFESEPDLSRWIIEEPWGIGEKRIEIEKLEERFSQPSELDTVRVDSTHAVSTMVDSSIQTLDLPTTDTTPLPAMTQKDTIGSSVDTEKKKDKPSIRDDKKVKGKKRVSERAPRRE
jgi:LPS export ABC transporter protein LptC